MSVSVQLLDATLRDGSYCVDFQFTAADTATLVGMLDSAGVPWIELGHGSGTFNHKAPPQFRSKVRQAARDEEYFAAARQCASRAKLGVMTGPFGTDDLEVLAAHRIDFVRLAVMADRALEPMNLKVAKRAKALGLLLSVNLMQTTALTPERVAEIAVEFAKAGTDWFYIVDSSGGMMPQAVTEYLSRARDAVPNLRLGFHAHHNSGLAIANCLTAIAAGATLVDGTLQGLGRDVGNAPTEQLLLMLQRSGSSLDVDVEQLCAAGDLARGLLLGKGNDPTYFASGISEIHSSNVESLVELAVRRGLRPRTLLAAIGQGDAKLIGAGMKTFPEHVIAPAIARTPPLSDALPPAPVVDVIAAEIARASSTTLTTLADVLFARAARWHLTGVLHVVPADQLPFAGPLPWTLDRWTGITVGVRPGELAGLDFADRAPGVLVVAPALAPEAPGAVVDALAPLLLEAALLVATAVAEPDRRLWFACADGDLAAQLAPRAGAGKVIGPTEPLDAIGSGAVVVVVGYRELPAALAALADRGVALLRPAFAPVIASRIAALLAVRARVTAAPHGELVDPLFVPHDRQIVVDDPQCPTTIVAGSTRPDDVAAAAKQRARTLWRGRGRL